MMRVADYVFDYLAKVGCGHVFVVTGGGAMFLNDGLAKCQGLKYVCCHHEQACAMAAEAYARVSGRLGVASVTTGPGGINALNGVFGAFVDSIPMLVISGQVKRETCLGSYNLPNLRQLGDQEVDIVRMAKGVTKYAVLVNDPKMIRYHLERAVHLARSGRPGPCWLDIPVDVQSAQIDPLQLRAYNPKEDDGVRFNRWDMEKNCRNLIALMQRAKRPVILVGSGIRLAGAVDLFDTVTRKLGIPIITAWTGVDLVANDNPLFCGRSSSLGDRAGNFAVQNADLLIVLGSRLNIRQVSYNWNDFARNAYKVQVDIDEAELKKPTIKPQLPILADLKEFLAELNGQLDLAGIDALHHADWLAWCRKRVARYPVVLDKHRAGEMINPYHFVDTLVRKLNEKDVVACGDGTACVVTFQTAFVKKGMRVFTNSGDASMGYDLPASIGSAFATGGRVICLAGDGSAQMNIQELQTIAYHKLPIKIFILNNGGYLSMRMTQGGFFKGNFIGESPRSGISFPDYAKLGEAHGIPSLRLEGRDFAAKLDPFLAQEGPGLCEVILDPTQVFEPKLSSRELPDGRIVTAPFEDMAPFLSREELAENMITPGPPERR